MVSFDINKGCFRHPLFTYEYILFSKVDKLENNEVMYIMNNEEKLSTCIEFRDRIVTILNEISNMAQCIIPLNGDDKKTIADGIDEIEKFTNNLKKADTLRELDHYIDINAYLIQSEEIDDAMEQSTTHQKFTRFMESLERMINEDEEI